jgi:hypothetical protein
VGAKERGRFGEELGRERVGRSRDVVAPTCLAVSNALGQTLCKLILWLILSSDIRDPFVPHVTGIAEGSRFIYLL